MGRDTPKGSSRSTLFHEPTPRVVTGQLDYVSVHVKGTLGLHLWADPETYFASVGCEFRTGPLPEHTRMDRMEFLYWLGCQDTLPWVNLYIPHDLFGAVGTVEVTDGPAESPRGTA
jgi:hypothetical protein